MEHLTPVDRRLLELSANRTVTNDHVDLIDETSLSASIKRRESIEAFVLSTVNSCDYNNDGRLID